MTCVRCKKRPAIIFVQRMENGQMKQEGYCLRCARELHIKPVEDMMKQLGMSDQDMDNMEERMDNLMGEMGDGANPLAMMMGMQQDGDGEGLGDIVVNSQGEAFQLAGFVIQSGQHDDGDVRFAPDDLADLPAVQTGQHQVQQHQIHMGGAKQ